MSVTELKTASVDLYTSYTMHTKALYVFGGKIGVLLSFRVL